MCGPIDAGLREALVVALEQKHLRYIGTALDVHGQSRRESAHPVGSYPSGADHGPSETAAAIALVSA